MAQYDAAGGAIHTINGATWLAWRKIHLGIDDQTLEIRAVESSLVNATGPKEPVDGNHIGDVPVMPDLLSQIPSKRKIGSVTADGAYDTRNCHDAIADTGAHAIIPHSRNARARKPTTAGAFAMALEPMYG